MKENSLYVMGMCPNFKGAMKMGQKVVLEMTIFNEDGSVFDRFLKESPSVDRRGVHAIQRSQLNAMSALLDTADQVLAEKEGTGVA